MKLVIIEAPAKRETLKKYLGSEYEVFATKGHIRDLPAKSFGVDMQTFDPEYVTMPDKKQLILDMQKKAKTAEQILIATDPDREGEAIGWHVATVLGIPKDKKCRIEYNEITKSAVQNAIKNPRAIDLKLVDAQQARRVLDRIVGYKLSPLLCKKIAPKLSAGRVQSVALKLVVDREKEIENFKPEEYWTVTAICEKNGEKFKASLEKYKDKKLELKSKQEVDKILECVKGKNLVCLEAKKTKTKSHAPAPFTTSTMQQDALNKLNMSLNKTTTAAQELYQGVEVAGEGKIALITYIRTDSTRVSAEAQKACLEYISNTYGKDYVPEKPNIYVAKKSAQDAHEAIRPISMKYKPELLKDSLSSDNYKLYKLIYERFLASQMADAQYASTTLKLGACDYSFKATGRVMLFPGYTKVYKEYNEEKQEAGNLPNVEPKEMVQCENITGEQKFTKPPARYTEASLVKALEEKEIGRPATYASIISVLPYRHYVLKEGKALVPTTLGRNVSDYIAKFFSSVINVKFTASLENRLDDIVETNEDWHEVVESFWNGFKELLEKAGDSNISMKPAPIETDIVCDKCGAKMLLREGRFGKFLGCSNFPKCKNIQKYEAERPKPVGKCPNCGKKVYPVKSKTGKTFFACEDREGCNFMCWDIPTGDKCEKCHMPLVRKGEKIICMNKDCENHKIK